VAKFIGLSRRSFGDGGRSRLPKAIQAYLRLSKLIQAILKKYFFLAGLPPPISLLS